MRIEKVVQGTYIKKELKQVLNKEAKRQRLFPATLASIILEKVLMQIMRKRK